MTSAYIYGQLNIDLFMECPEYFQKILELIMRKHSDRNKSGKSAKIRKSVNESDNVLFLKKSLYGLKHVGICWNTKLNEISNVFAGNQTKDNPCLYCIKNEKRFVLLVIYVCDIMSQFQFN